MDEKPTKPEPTATENGKNYIKWISVGLVQHHHETLFLLKIQFNFFKLFVLLN
jgi:hypothetical protein